jgi:hypothetical protein
MLTECMTIDEQIQAAQNILQLLRAIKGGGFPGAENYTPEQLAAQLAWVEEGRKDLIINFCLDLLIAQNSEWQLLEPLRKELKLKPPQ